MCGITGFVLPSKAEAAARGGLETMCRVMTHRGPDDQGIFLEPPGRHGRRSEKVVGLGNAPGDARPDPYEARTPAAELTELGKKIVGVEPWPGLPFE